MTGRPEEYDGGQYWHLVSCLKSSLKKTMVRVKPIRRTGYSTVLYIPCHIHFKSSTVQSYTTVSKVYDCHNCHVKNVAQVIFPCLLVQNKVRTTVKLCYYSFASQYYGRNYFNKQSVLPMTDFLLPSV